jgi:hypothetical protein
MSKLLTEPRPIKEITEKPKKKRYQKIIAILMLL